MWKYITRNVRETFERRICSSLTDSTSKEKRSSCNVNEKFIPTLTRFCDKNSSNKKFSNSTQYEEKQHDKTHNSSWSDEYHRRTWLGAVGWSTALVFSWNILQPLCRYQFLHENEKKHSWKQYNGGCWKEHTGWQWKKDYKSNRKCPLQSEILRYKKGTAPDHHDHEEHFWKSVPKRYEKTKNHTTYNKEKEHSENAIYSGIWRILTHAVWAQPTQIIPKPVQFEKKTSVKEKEANIPYGPVTAEQALEDATKNLVGVQNSVMGDIDNRLGVDLMHKGKHQEAVSQFSKAASLNNASASYNLGVCYEMGLGTNQDFRMAAKYYKHASEQGHATAMYNLGVFYVHGWGGLQSDCNEAQNLFKKASALGQKEAKKALAMVENQEFPEVMPADETNHSQGIVQQALGLVQDLGLGLEVANHPELEVLQVSKVNDYKDISDLVHDSILKYTSMLQK